MASKKKKLKIYICAIAKDEEKFVNRFMDSVKDADKVIVCDTGSTDKTIQLLKKKKAEVHEIQVSPFRFDLARNMTQLHCEDADIVIALDLDEIMLPDWRKTIEKNWKKGTTMLRSSMIFNWADKEQTKPNMTVWSVKIYDPKKYIWIDPIHEHLVLREGAEENPVTIKEHLMRHYPDPDKPERGGRIKMLEKWAKDEPDNARASYALGREYALRREHKKCATELQRYLEISVAYTNNERYSRSHACRMIAQSLINQKKINPDEIVTWFLRSVGENPSQREPWVWLGWAWGCAGDKDMAGACLNRAKMITDKTQSIVMEEGCWGERLDNLIKEL